MVIINDTNDIINYVINGNINNINDIINNKVSFEAISIAQAKAATHKQAKFT